MKYSGKGKFFVFIILLGALLGTLLGEILGSKFKVLDFLKLSYTLGTPKNIDVDLKVLSFSFGVNFYVNFMTIIGIILAIIIIYRKQ